MSNSGSRLNALTSLRLIAALMVVIHHSRGSLLPVDLTAPAIEAVSFFFVLSGFILTYSYHQRDYTIRAFYTARLTRIMPATVLSIVLFFVLNQQTPNIANPDELAVTASNLLLIQAWIPLPRYYFALNAVAWSVSVEAGFYLLFPLLHRVLTQNKGRVFIIAIPLIISSLLLGICLWKNLPFHTSTQPNQITWIGLIYISPLARLKEFCLGMLAGHIYIQLRANDSLALKNKLVLSITEIALLGLLIMGFLKVSVPLTQNPNLIGIFWYQIATGALFAGIIIVLAAENSLISQSLNSQWLLTGGEMSFSIYLFHQMLITWQAKHPWLLSWAPVQARFMIMLCFILAFSYAIWRWFERPMRTGCQRLLERC